MGYLHSRNDFLQGRNMRDPDNQVNNENNIPNPKKSVES
jgi:hypothetical protein